MQIKLISFRAGDIDGVWLWKLQSDGHYARSCLFRISDPFVQYGVEVVSYDQLCIDGAVPQTSLLAEIVREPGDPDTVTLNLGYQRSGRPIGTYRASAYNTIGESGLSSASVQL